MSDRPSVEEFLAAWEAQGPSCRVSQAELDFIAAMRRARSQGVGFGWMRQIIGVESMHMHVDPVSGQDDDTLLRLYGVDREAQEHGWERDAEKSRG